MAEHLSDLLEQYLARRAAGENPSPEEYRDQAGDAYLEFIELLAAESALDVAMGLETDTLPRAFGAYTLLRELGRGAAGVVYEALHRELGRTVALKILRLGFDTSAEAIERFRREAVACAQTRHDHIVEVYEAGEEDGRPYYAMTLLKGKSLGELAAAKELPEPRELCKQLAGIADALHCLHERDIVHRDVKPSNIMVEESGRMVLADFGLARTVSGKALTQTGEALGTPLYMSPEQLLGQRAEIDGRTDVYGLGATLYKILADRPMFGAEDLTQMVMQILHERPQSLGAVNADTPAEVERIVMKAVEKRQDDRYQSAAEMRDDLLACARGDAVKGRPVSAMTHGVRRVRRMWMPLTAAAALLIASVWWLGSRDATLVVDCYPQAEVLLNGNLAGTTPVGLELSPGDHTVTLRTGGFLERTQPITVGAGEKKSMQFVLIAEDDNPAALKRLAAKWQVAMAELDTVRRSRGADDETHVLFPRGPVRMADLDDYVLRLSPDYDEGTLEFRAGDVTLYKAPYDPEELDDRAPIPAVVKKALRAGMKVTWGVYSADGDKTAAFEVVESDIALPDDEAFAAQPATIQALVRGQLLLDKKLYLAAANAARGVLEDQAGNKSALAQLQAALQGMELEGENPAWNDLTARVDALEKK